jgi:pyrimidine operon attenuation protein/uracil phosphoribosyltransferase
MAERIASAAQIAAHLDALAAAIVQDCPTLDHAYLIGIQRRGVQLANRLAERILAQTKVAVPLGVLDITFYRDDLSMISQQPVVHNTDIRLGLDGKVVYLVDDVVYTGRTIRAALDALADYGRPRIVRLVALVDRGWRELPIQPDFVALKIETTLADVIHVKVRELDGEDAVDRVTHPDRTSPV